MDIINKSKEKLEPDFILSHLLVFHFLAVEVNVILYFLHNYLSASTTSFKMCISFTKHCHF